MPVLSSVCWVVPMLFLNVACLLKCLLRQNITWPFTRQLSGKIPHACSQQKHPLMGLLQLNILSWKTSHNTTGLQQNQRCPLQKGTSWSFVELYIYTQTHIFIFITHKHYMALYVNTCLWLLVFAYMCMCYCVCDIMCVSAYVCVC